LIETKKSGQPALFLCRDAFPADISTQGEVVSVTLLYNRCIMPWTESLFDSLPGGGTKEMSGMAFTGGMIVAFIIDLVGIVVPVLGTVFICLMKLSFWLVGYDMRETKAIALANGAAEILPIVPGCMVFMGLSWRKNKKNIKERKKKANKEGLLQGEMMA
jgi:hypothetical protein